MKNILFLAALLLAFTAVSQTTGMPAHTKAAVTDIQKDLRTHRIPSPHIQNWYPIYRQHGIYYVATLCKVNSSFSKQAALNAGLDVGAVAGRIASIRIPVNMFTWSFSFPGIDYMEVAEKIEPFLNNAVPDTRADSVHMGINLPQPYTGKNVFIGVVDWGFEYAHPAFFDTTLTQNRIFAAWDQVKNIGTHPAGFSHGALYTDTAQLMAAQKDTFARASDMHGTHVAGIAGGSGGGTAYRGIGFESQFLFSQLRTDASSSMDAFQWMYETARNEGKPLVINNSWGGYRGVPLDGTSLLNEGVQSYIDSGVTFVFSAANNGAVNFHLKKTFANDSVRTRITGFQYSSDSTLWGQTAIMWGDVGNNFSAQLRILNSSNVLKVQSPLYNTATAPAYLDTFMITGNDTIFYKWTTDAAHPLNGRPQMTLDVKCTNTSLRCILYSEAATGTVHYWNLRMTIYGASNWGYAFSSAGLGYVNGDKNYGIGHPSTGNNVITAAAHNSGGGIANFSSIGPRMDEVPKPDISAPGANIGSALNSYALGSYAPVASVTFNNKVYQFTKLSGTSMSGPMVTGVIALMLEASPYLQPWQIKNIIKDNARTDNFTGAIPAGGHVRWGMGKLNAYAAMGAVFVTGVSETTQENTWSIYPNPASNHLFVSGKLDGTETYTLTALDGKQLQSGKLINATIDISTLSAGMYVVVVKNNVSTETFRVVVE